MSALEEQEIVSFPGKGQKTGPERDLGTGSKSASQREAEQRAALSSVDSGGLVRSSVPVIVQDISAGTKEVSPASFTSVL